MVKCFSPDQPDDRTHTSLKLLGLPIAPEKKVSCIFRTAKSRNWSAEAIEVLKIFVKGTCIEGRRIVYYLPLINYSAST